MTTTTKETQAQMAAVARMVRDGSMVLSGGRRLPLRYWVALAAVEGK